MSKGFWQLLAVGFLYSVYPVFAVTARLAHDGGAADASRRAASESLELENTAGFMALGIFARRDALAQDRDLTNVLALAGAAVELEGHRFQFSLGSHYRHERLNARTNTPGSFYPAVGFLWSHAVFRSEVIASEFATRASGSFLLEMLLPLEFNSEFEYLHSQPYRWSAQIYAYLSAYGGLILGYEPLSNAARAGAWLSPIESLKLRTIARLANSGETYFEISLQYSLDVAQTVESQASEPYAPKRVRQKKRRLPEKVPAFATLVKWGLSPVEALRFTREKDACALSESARASLARKNWGCRDAA
jgi:hypothetical protein